eukprot:CAMPEP_0185552638 /NCGR_PEP_ID=MMETSP1381-20130426/34439_1 /TAXON_ID=298111 /ORGANISM="Pavlova sp., Strain CCMP459" /LENGTH=42 /DNA_ID= /DNA_START= /DNA_END= /DNA_ORIENTATION=
MAVGHGAGDSVRTVIVDVREGGTRFDEETQAVLMPTNRRGQE